MTLLPNLRRRVRSALGGQLLAVVPATPGDSDWLGEVMLATKSSGAVVITKFK